MTSDRVGRCPVVTSKHSKDKKRQINEKKGVKATKFK